MEHTHKAAVQDVEVTPKSPTVNGTAQEVPAAPKIDMRELIDVASQIARMGYSESVIALAMHRKGVSHEVARLVAASVTSCRAMIVASEAHVRRDKQPIPPIRSVDLRGARAASLALSKITSFIVFFMVGVGGGVFIGWSIGFNQGIDDGFDWVVRAIERLM